MVKKSRKWLAHFPSPKTVGELRNALSGYEDDLSLEKTCKIYIVEEKNKPYKMRING